MVRDLSCAGVLCGLAFALAGGATGLATGADQRSFGFGVALGGGALGRLFPADGGKALGLCALSTGVAFCGCVLAAGGGDPGRTTGADQRSSGFAAETGGGVLGRCATLGGGIFRCGALEPGDGDPGLTTGADQGILGFAVALVGGALGLLFADGGGSVPGRCAAFTVAGACCAP